MPVTTFLHDGELNQPTGNAALDALLAEVRTATKRDYQVVIHTSFEQRGFLGMRLRKVTRTCLYVHVGGMGPWQWLASTTTVEEVYAYLLGLINGVGVERRTTPAPSDRLQLFPIGSKWPTRRKREAFDWLQDYANAEGSPEEAQIVLSELHALSSKAYPQPMELAPCDGTMVRLLVQFEANATEDTAGPAWTIGANNDDNVGEEERLGWQFAGWSWVHDCFTDGRGTPVAWLPIVGDFSEPARTDARAALATAAPALNEPFGNAEQLPAEAVGDGASDMTPDLVPVWHAATAACLEHGRYIAPTTPAQWARVLRAVAGITGAAPAPAAPAHGDDAHDGLRFVMCQFGTGDHYRDFLLIPHADGQYVTAAKLQPFGSRILRAQLAKLDAAAQPSGAEPEVQ